LSTEDVTIDDLKRILRTCAGETEDVDLDGDILDVEFDALGYDSLALLETAAQLSQEYHVELDDDATIAARTPRELLGLVNATAGR
jgi:act minimal PKS acyl carrier protein